MSTPLWLTDRSRYSTGTGRCARERFLTYHAGPTGYGLTKTGEALPLLTGGLVHVALEPLFLTMKTTDSLPPVDFIRSSIQSALYDYEQTIRVKGFRGLLQSERSDYVVREQQALITGLVWGACRLVLPGIHRDYRILEVETETIYVLDCTCGLGSAIQDQAAHEARDCQGIGVQLRQDVVAQKRQGGGLAYFETKTTGWAGDTWTSQWETKPQLAIGSFGLFERYQKELTETFIIGLYKGARKTRGEGVEAIKVQDSPFCYGKCKPGNPPLSVDDWKPAYEWVNDDGVTQYARRPYENWPIWQLPDSDWAPFHQAKQVQPNLTPEEFWSLLFLPKSVIEKQVFLVGPMNPQTRQAESLKRQIVGEERDWQRKLWDLYESTTLKGLSWSDSRYQAELDRIVPASYDCRRFGAAHECSMADLCFYRQGWESFEGYVPRRPHHRPELDQAIARGLLPPEAADVEDGDE